uniref:Uncharacterized protein n=1 Tax=Arundo donax TaxID=35708 RepID=A0A0A9CGT9_ARUDO
MKKVTAIGKRITHPVINFLDTQL